MTSRVRPPYSALLFTNASERVATQRPSCIRLPSCSPCRARQLLMASTAGLKGRLGHGLYYNKHSFDFGREKLTAPHEKGGRCLAMAAAAARETVGRAGEGQRFGEPGTRNVGGQRRSRRRAVASEERVGRVRESGHMSRCVTAGLARVDPTRHHHRRSLPLRCSPPSPRPPPPPYRPGGVAPPWPPPSGGFAAKYDGLSSKHGAAHRGIRGVQRGRSADRRDIKTGLVCVVLTSLLSSITSLPSG